MEKTAVLLEKFDALDEQLVDLETQVAAESQPPLSSILPRARAVVRGLLQAYAEDMGKPMLVTDDLLAMFKAFVKGDPSLNTVRDNVRELVYYQNCLDMNREDALPKMPSRMAVRTARHIYLYLRSRCEQENRFD